MPDITWTVTEASGESRGSHDKHPYTPERLETESMSDKQKAFVREFNSMRAMLIKNDMMETR